MLKSISKGKAWSYLLILLTLFIIISYVSYSPEQKQYRSFDADSPSPTGVKAFLTYLGKEKSLKRWTHSPNLLGSKKERQLLIIVEPFFTPKSEEMEEYTRFMEDGNTVLLLKKNPKDFFSLNTAPASNLSERVGTINSFDRNNYRGEISSPFRLVPNKNDKILLSDDGGIIALKRPIGKGVLIASTAPEWITNGEITKYDHTNLLVTLLNEETAQNYLFDEYIQGGENAAKLTKVYPFWFLMLVFQGGIIVILSLWSLGKRFGPIDQPREDSVRFSD